MAAIPGAYYQATPTGWVARGRPTLPINIDREALVLGAYIPGPGTAGLLPGWTPAMLDPVYADSAGNITITGPGPYENKLFWGTLNMKSPTPPVFRNCATAGRRPYLYASLDANGFIVANSEVSGSVAGLIKCFGTGFHPWVMTDSLIAGDLWLDASLNPPGGAVPLWDWRRLMAFSAGVHGGWMTLQRCEIRNVQDGWSMNQTRTSVDDMRTSVVQGNWWHSGVYYFGPDWVNTTDGPHADGNQTNTGGDALIEGNAYGGAVDTTGYLATPYKWNSGASFYNADFMLKQEVDDGDLRRIRNLRIRKNFLWPMLGPTAYSINHFFVTSRPGGFTEGCDVTENYLVRDAREQYINRSSEFAALYSGNRVIDVNPDRTFTIGELAPINNA